MLVSRKPAAVWTASAEPAVPAGASSDTAAENCAESATTVIPQTMATTRVTATGAPKSSAEAIALSPDAAMAAIVVVVRPTRSASSPATMQPMPPLATTANAAELARTGSAAPAVAKLAARKSGIHVHMAYSSHM